VSLAAGEKLGPYEIVEPIGKGGMGEVYRARDSRLGRDVAIKVSAERFNDWFEREARAVAALNHPNISALYDVGPNYLVMELVEGESPKGPLPLDEVLRIMKQIAEALSEAHEKGIVHRDLKPGNIKIRPDGAVKVLDFGLAKMSATSAQPAADADDLPTASLAATTPGVILGTAGYMAPEQARGKPTDKRADIRSFGVVFHELLTGRRTFAGEDMTETLAKVLQAEPSWQSIPANVQRLLKKCLEKDPKKRLRDIGDAWELLDAVPAATSHRSGGRLWPGVAVVLALTLAVILALRLPWRAETPPDRPLVRFDMDVGSDVTLEDPGLTAVNAILSPAGDRLAYVAHHANGPVKLFTRRLDQTQATELPGTEGAFSPFFSPDGQWLGFAAKRSRLVSKNAGYTYTPRFSPDGKRLAVAAGDGTSVDIWVHEGERSFKLTNTNGPYFAPIWSPDGRYVFLGSNHGIYWSRADVAGQPQRLIESKSITYPSSFSPDGRRLAYIELGESGGRGGTNEVGIAPLQFESGQWKADKPEKFSGSGLGVHAMISPDGNWLAYSTSETGSEEVYVRAAIRPVSGDAGPSLISENGGRAPVWSRTSHELLYQSGDRIMAVTYSATGDHFEVQKPRLWLDKIGSQLWDLAPDGKHLA
jgi:Tol biopolymer transport system component/predicted Ser/Thr protein kinase